MRARRIRQACLLVCAAGVVAGACASSADVENVAMLVPATTRVGPPSTTVAPTTTTRQVTTTAPASTIASTTTIALPVPAPIPDPGAIEPDIALATLEIPRIGLTDTMWEGVTLGTLDAGPGHWPGSAMPGQIGNMVVAGHRMSHSRPFEDLDQLRPGDEMTVTDAAGVHVYRVVRSEIVNPDALWILDQSPAPTATLFACHPKGSTKQRIVVFLELSGTT